MVLSMGLQKSCPYPISTSTGTTLPMTRKRPHSFSLNQENVEKSYSSRAPRVYTTMTYPNMMKTQSYLLTPLGELQRVTKWEVEAARDAHQALGMVGNLSERDFKGMVHNNMKPI